MLKEMRYASKIFNSLFKQKKVFLKETFVKRSIELFDVVNKGKLKM